METKNDEMSFGDKTIGVIVLLMVYLVIGTFVGAALSSLDMIPDRDHITNAETISVMLFWPLFLVKALAIGAWAVLESGYHLLIGA